MKETQSKNVATGTRAGIGRSLLRDAYEAGREAAKAASEGLSGATVDLCLVFATAEYDQEALLRGIREVTGDVKLSGCSGEGVISGSHSDEREYAVAVMVVSSPTLEFDTFLLRNYSEDPARRGRELAAHVAERSVDDAVCLFVFPDGIRGNCTMFLDSLSKSLPFSVPITGGTTADGMRFEQTFQYCDGEVASDGIAAVLVRGRGRLEFAVSHGCVPIGLERRITRTDGGWLYEIDGEPAWNVFKEYLDSATEDLNAEGIVHLCVGLPLDEPEAEGYAPYNIRTPVRLDKSNGALFFPGGGLETGQTIRLTRRDQATIKHSARACAQRIVARQPSKKPAFVVQFDCAGRGHVLFGSAAAREIIEPLQETLGPEVPWIGCHTYGEVAPIGDRVFYHNYTVVLGAVYDEA